jgi:transposase-like protein
MRLKVRIPRVSPEVMQVPDQCPYQDCDGQHFKPHEYDCDKPLRDTKYSQVKAQRYQCLRCQRTFRVYPQGVSEAHHSDSLKGLAVLLYILGLSYGAVSDVLDALGWFLGKTTVFRDVQAMGGKAQQLREAWLQQGQRIQAIGADLTRVKCNGENLVVGVVVDDHSGIELAIDILEDESAETILAWLYEVVELVGAEVLVSDDADAFKIVAEDLGLDHQICRGHVTSNVLDHIGQWATQTLEAPAPLPEGMDIPLEQFWKDLEQLQWLVQAHPHDGADQLEQLHLRYCQAPPPRKGEKATRWYGMRLLTLHLWDNWDRLTLYQRWQGQKGERLDGTNNATERAIGWGVKERYRSMRGYKRPQSVLNVSSLLGWLGNQPDYYDLSELIAA